MAQDALNRWWWPSIMMFGPSDADSKHTAQSMRWKIKRFTNDELRQKFIDITAPQAEFLGLTIPDPSCARKRAASTTVSGPIDWSEFQAVFKGNGPCNRERLEARRKAHEAASGCGRRRPHTRKSIASGPHPRRRPEALGCLATPDGGVLC